MWGAVRALDLAPLRHLSCPYLIAVVLFAGRLKKRGGEGGEDGDRGRSLSRGSTRATDSMDVLEAGPGLLIRDSFGIVV